MPSLKLLSGGFLSAIVLASQVLGQATPTTDDGTHEDGTPHQAEVLGCAHAAHSARQFKNRPISLEAPPAIPLALAGADDEGGIAGAVDPTDVLHYDLDLEIVPATDTLIGVNIITVRCVTGPVSTFNFQLHQNFTISSVQVNGTPITYNRVNVANVVATLDRAYIIGEEFDLRIAYSGVPVSGGFGSINFSTQNAQDLVFTLSEPFYAYTWWPVKEDNRDKATGEMAYTVPNTMKVASNGIRQGIDVVAGNKTRHRWATDYPTTPYLFCFSATNYNEFTDTWDVPGVGGQTMPMQFFIYPASDTPTNRNAWLITKQQLTTFSELYGTYPFVNEKYGIYQFGFGGGMEHQTMTGQGGFSSSLTAHELAHQWWGDMVTCATFNHIWLNEGFATYSEALWLEFLPGSTGTPALLSAMSARRPSSNGSTAIVYRNDISSASVIFNSNAVYNKGAWVLHMLRHVMGDADFFAAINDYRSQYEYSTAVTEDFQAVCETHYGSSLEFFFNQWVYNLGAPTYQTAWRNINVNGQNYVELLVNQTQNVAWLTFEMPVDIRTTPTGGGATSITPVYNDERSEHFLFAAPGNVAITAIAVDPSNYILHPASTTTTFVEGPPKIVTVSPLPGSQNDAGTVNAIAITFHKNVNAQAAQFSVQGAVQGSVPFTFAYSPATLTATLTLTSPLNAADAYTVSVSDSLTDVAANLALDGELANATSPASLPSGEGKPGGAAAFTFNVTGQPITCLADIAPIGSPNGSVNVDDLLAVINAWGPCANPNACPADIAPAGPPIGNDVVNVDDLLAVINGWGACP